MGTSLTGKQIKSTYKSLIKVSDNTEASATAKQLSDGNGNDFGLYIDTDGVFGIGSAASYSLDVSSKTDGIALPVGTTANRPTGAAGLIRYNTSDAKLEYYDTAFKKIASETYVNTQINNLIDSAPGTLDTLNEIAAALNDDPNFYNTITTLISAKQDTLTAGDITFSLLDPAAIITSTESFVDNDTTLMTSAAIADKIESYGYSTTTGDITGVTAGTGLSGGGTTGTVTLNLDGTGTVGAGTYGSTSDATKIDTITVDAYGRVTAVATGATGDIASVQFTTDSGTATDGSGTAAFTISGGTNVTTSASGSVITIDAASGATYTAGAGIDIDGSNIISVESDLTNDVVTFGEDSSNYMTIQSWTGHRFITNGAEKMRLELDGDLHVDGDVVAFSTTVSDKRLKDDVQTIDNALETIEKLRGVSYIWNKGKRQGKKDIGLIAQEVEAVIPEIVHEKKMSLIDDEVYKTIDYEKLVGVLIEAVKELSAEVKELKAQING